jgi:hypothetical protein
MKPDVQRPQGRCGNDIERSPGRAEAFGPSTADASRSQGNRLLVERSAVAGTGGLLLGPQSKTGSRELRLEGHRGTGAASAARDPNRDGKGFGPNEPEAADRFRPDGSRTGPRSLRRRRVGRREGEPRLPIGPRKADARGASAPWTERRTATERASARTKRRRPAGFDLTEAGPGRDRLGEDGSGGEKRDFGSRSDLERRAQGGLRLSGPNAEPRRKGLRPEPKRKAIEGLRPDGCRPDRFGFGQGGSGGSKRGFGSRSDLERWNGRRLRPPSEPPTGSRGFARSRRGTRKEPWFLSQPTREKGGSFGSRTDPPGLNGEASASSDSRTFGKGGSAARPGDGRRRFSFGLRSRPRGNRRGFGPDGTRRRNSASAGSNLEKSGEGRAFAPDRNHPPSGTPRR